jgi:hypothetical protein
MGSQTAANAALAFSAASPATADAAGYGALTFTDVGQIDKIGAFGASFDKVEFQPLKGAKQKYKGAPDYGALAPSYAIDSSDAGQTLIQTASDDESQKLYSARVTYQDGSKRFFQTRVFGAPETVDGASSMIMANPALEICSKIVRVNGA